jgi:hypothetical protein
MPQDIGSAGDGSWYYRHEKREPMLLTSFAQIAKGGYRVSIPTKVCRSCCIEKPATAEFYMVRPRCKSGFDNQCRKCGTAKTMARYVARGGRSEEEKAALKLYDAQRYWGNVEFHRARALAWRKANPEKAATTERNRRAKILAAGGTHDIDDVMKQISDQSDVCYWCQGALGENWEVDHIFPVSRGGTNGPENICVSCFSCNRSKNAKMPWDFNGRLF